MLWIEFVYILFLIAVLVMQRRLSRQFKEIRADIRQIGSMAARIEGKDLEIRLKERPARPQPK